MLLTPLASEQAQERRLAVTVIEDVRNGKGSSLPRRFDVPPVNFEAQCLEELIDWKTVPVTEPLLVLTTTMTTEEVKICLDQPLSASPTWQSHFQSVERSVKVSDSCRSRTRVMWDKVGRIKREGWVRCAEDSRRILKKPNTKADYKALFDLAFN